MSSTDIPEGIAQENLDTQPDRRPCPLNEFPKPVRIYRQLKLQKDNPDQTRLYFLKKFCALRARFGHTLKGEPLAITCWATGYFDEKGTHSCYQKITHQWFWNERTSSGSLEKSLKFSSARQRNLPNREEKKITLGSKSWIVQNWLSGKSYRQFKIPATEIKASKLRKGNQSFYAKYIPKTLVLILLSRTTVEPSLEKFFKD